jgi:membrane protein DedA with SNARE-associated domain
VQELLTWLRDLPPWAVYLVAASVIFAETGLIVGLVLPGEVTLFLVGYLAYTGTLRLPVAVLVMVAAAMAGDGLAYAKGRRAGRHRRHDDPRDDQRDDRYGRLGGRVGRRRLARAQAILTRHGGRAVAVGRFVAFARTVVPRLVGMSGVPYRRILPWDVVGVLGQVAGSVLVGYLAGESYARVADVFGRATGAALLLALVVAALVVIGRYVGRHRTPVTAFGAQLLRTWPLRWLERRYTAGFHRLTARFGPDGALAANVALGVPVLLAIGYALTWLIDRLVRHSGLPLVDPEVARWFVEHRTPGLAQAAQSTLGVLRGSYLVAAVAVVGFALAPRRRSGRVDHVEVLATAGAFAPLLILAVATDLARLTGPVAAVLPNQVTLVTAGLGTLAGLLTRRLRWGAAVAGWTVAFGVVVLVGGARMYVGWDWPSQVVASTLLGALWVLMFVVAWHTHTRTRAAAPADEPPRPREPAPSGREPRPR